MTGATLRFSIVFACLLWPGVSPAADGDLARLDGKAEIRRFGGGWRQAWPGDRLSPGDRVRTSDTGAALVILPGGWMVELGGSASMELNESLPPDYPATMALFEGSARAILRRPEPERLHALEVFTAAGRVVISAGDAGIFVAQDGSVRAVPEDGVTSAGSGGGQVESRSGQSLEISPGGKATAARTCPSCTDEWRASRQASLRVRSKQSLDALLTGIKLSADRLASALDELSGAEKDVTDLVDRMRKARKNREKERSDLSKAALEKFAALWKSAADAQEARNTINASAAAIRTILSSSASVAADGGTAAVKEPAIPGILDEYESRLKKLRTGFRSIFHERIGEFMDIFDGLMP